MAIRVINTLFSSCGSIESACRVVNLAESRIGIRTRFLFSAGCGELEMHPLVPTRTTTNRRDGKDGHSLQGTVCALAFYPRIFWWLLRREDYTCNKGSVSFPTSSSRINVFPVLLTFATILL